MQRGFTKKLLFQVNVIGDKLLKLIYFDTYIKPGFQQNAKFLSDFAHTIEVIMAILLL